MQLAGRVALVTGGSRGIGRAACLGLAREGAAVAVHYNRGREEAERVAEEIGAAGGRATCVQADVTEPDEVERMIEEVTGFAGPGGLHVLFNNAGIYPAGSLETLSVEEWDRVIAVNVRGPFLCTKAALPLLKRARRARLINIGSVIPFLGMPGFIHYSTAKAALSGFTHSLARELAEYGMGGGSPRRAGDQARPATRGSRRGDRLPRLGRERLHDRPDDRRGRREGAPVRRAIDESETREAGT